MDLLALGKILRHETASLEERTICSLEEMEAICAYLRQAGFKVTSTTGVWDMIHVGHCRYLEKTREQGHISIVEVDSDELVRERKSKKDLHRPIVPLAERMEMLAYLRCVDILYPLFPCKNTTEFVEVMRPDVFVVSETSEDSKEPYLQRVRPHCGEVVILKAQSAVSTTRRVRKMMMAGGLDALGRVKEIVDELIDTSNSQASDEEEDCAVAEPGSGDQRPGDE